MKGKIVLSVLFCLMLAFGMIVSCDNGAFPVDPNKDSDTVNTLDHPEGGNVFGEEAVNGALGL